MDLKYLPEDQKIVNELGMLFAEWESWLEKNNYFKATGLSPDCFVMDGIFPGYAGQKIRILYIGRESYDLDGFHYIEKHWEWIKSASFNGKSLNQVPVWRKLLKFTWGILHGKSWDEIPDAEDLSVKFAEPDGFSFGIENISKISRPWNGSSDANWEIIRGFVNASLSSGKNFYRREISIINPDLVICMNLIEKMEDAVFGGKLEYKKNIDPDTAIFKLEVDGRIVPLLDTWHFSARKNEARMYDSLRRAIMETEICNKIDSE